MIQTVLLSSPLSHMRMVSSHISCAAASAVDKVQSGVGSDIKPVTPSIGKHSCGHFNSQC